MLYIDGEHLLIKCMWQCNECCVLQICKFLILKIFIFLYLI